MSARFRTLSVSIALVMGAGALSSIAPATAAPDDTAFAPLRGFSLSGDKIRVEPKEYAATRVDLSALRADLPSGDATAVVEIPGPDGSLESFRVQRSQTMESELAAAHPEIQTWSGVGVDDPQASIALDITPMGFHAFVREPGAQADWYVDPAFNRRGTTTHLSYRSSDLPAPAKRRAEGEVEALRETVTEAGTADRVANVATNRRYYRLALTSDPSYAAYFGSENVLAEKVTLINRVNEIYNDDLAVELRLVNDTDALNLDTDAKATGADGPCGSAPCFAPYDDNGTPDDGDDTFGDLDFCSGATLGKNRTVLGQLIGASNYDVGHIALGVNGGGVAYLGVIGGDYKGGGCTGLPEPKGDFFAIDYVAHEIGHQFGGNHTFNGALGACGGNISDASVEPGSGSSVMAYAGICGQDDLQPHTDPYFSFLTVDEAYATMDQAPYGNVEVQTVSLRGFGDAGDSFTLEFGGETTDPIVAGTNYTPAGIKAAIEEVVDQPVSIAQWGFDEFDVPVAAPDETGFQVIFNATPSILAAGNAVEDQLAVTNGSAGVSGFVGETARGGPSQAQGFPLESDNTNPSVSAGEDKVVPIRTPFALSGSGSDADGDSLVYLWEQTNFGEGTRLSSNTKVYGPLFRVFGDDAVVTEEDTLKSPSPGINLADGNPNRVFPDMAQVLAGNTNAATGDCPAAVDAAGAPLPNNRQLPDTLLDCYSEYLPDTDYLGSLDADDRKMNFRLTARDLAVRGGGLAFDDVTLTVDPSAGPFLVTSQSAPGATVAGGTSVPVTWAVNGTQRLAENVRITVSTDGGATFGTVLAASTPNDGSETFVMPNVTASDVRIRIEAVGNYFFDVNDASFALKATPAPDTTITSGPADGSIVLERNQTITYASSVTPATFVCTVDDEPVACDAAGLTDKFRAGTHVLTVAAVNAAGVADPTPATLTFTVPRNSSTFARKGKGAWDVKKDARAFSGKYLTSKRKGSELVTRVKKTERIVVVFGKLPKGGVARVFLGKDRIGKIRFKGEKAYSQLRTFRFDEAQKGKLRIVVAKNKPVRIEGVAVVTSD